MVMRNNLNPRYDATEFGKLDFYKQNSVYKKILNTFKQALKNTTHLWILPLENKCQYTLGWNVKSS